MGTKKPECAQIGAHLSTKEHTHFLPMSRLDIFALWFCVVSLVALVGPVFALILWLSALLLGRIYKW